MAALTQLLRLLRVIPDERSLLKGPATKESASAPLEHLSDLSPEPVELHFPSEKEVDLAYARYIRNLGTSPSELDDPEVMLDMYQSIIDAAQDPSQISDPPDFITLPYLKEKLDLYSKLNLSPPSNVEAQLTTGGTDWYKEYNLLAPPMSYERFLKKRYGLDIADILPGDRSAPARGEPK